MKRILIFALATLLLMTACQATPEAEIVVEKNTDQMIDKARETPNVTNMGATLDTYAPKWSYETLNITVDDSGIFGVSWAAPVAVGEIVAENSTLKPFSEIEEIARKMLPVIYEPQAKEEYLKRVAITIDRVTLGLFRVAEQDRFDHGLYIPVWNFFGTYSETGGSDTEYTNATVCTLLTINAIDGSIIDVERGY